MKFDPEVFKHSPVLGIIRGIAENSLKGTLGSASEAGIKFLEITLNTENALDLIRQAVEDHSNSLCIGAGTVLNLKQAGDAVSAGARFIVSPTLNTDVANYCREKDVPYFPGALTPTEIERAWNSGATMVKVFPSSLLGTRYFREVRGPFQDIHLMAVGGVTKENVADYFESGASAVAVGASVFSVSRMVNGEYSMIRDHLKEILFAVQTILNTMK